MKKIFALALIAVLCLTFIFGCNEDKNDKNVETDVEVTDGQETVGQTEEQTSAETTDTEPVETQPEEPAPLGYIAPDGWYVPQFETGSVSGGDYDLVPEVMGLKVYYIQKEFGMTPNIWGYYRSDTIKKVKSFQLQNGLAQTGNVDLATWTAMGFSEDDWNCLGSYVSPVRIKREYDREQITNAFVEAAMEYIGTPYVVGASGKPGEGVDCSGLVLQCMYAIGVYPDGIDPVQHSTVEEYNSRLMWADPKLKEVGYDDLLVGDLVFYRRPWSDRVCHVAVYTGGDECVEALYDEVEILPLFKDDDGYAVMGFKRVIAD